MSRINIIHIISVLTIFEHTRTSDIFGTEICLTSRTSDGLGHFFLKPALLRPAGLQALGDVSCGRLILHCNWRTGFLQVWVLAWSTAHPCSYAIRRYFPFFVLCGVFDVNYQDAMKSCENWQRASF